ncbi:MAG: 4-hydroxybenzoate 3-monooxygenase [Bacteroidota bacterium]
MGANPENYITQIAILGAGPAGLFLARLLHNAGIECIVLEAQSEAYVRERNRAGIFEQTSVDAIMEAGVGVKLSKEGVRHQGVSFQYAGKRKYLNIQAVNDGKTVVAYSQQNLINDLLDHAQIDGIKAFFDSEVIFLGNLEARPAVHIKRGDHQIVVKCDLVIGCDGYHGISRKSIPQIATHEFEKTYPYSLLGVSMEMSPLENNIIFAHSEDGFAVQSMRGPLQTKFYLQCPVDSSVEEWREGKIRRAIMKRMGIRYFSGTIKEVHMVPLRSFVCGKLRHGKLLLAGDAAHIVPPTGAKGMNCAIADVSTMADCVIRYFKKGGREEELDHYENRALERIWKVVRFSNWMTKTLYKDPHQDEFDTQLQLAAIDRIFTSDVAAKDFMENFTGIPHS